MKMRSSPPPANMSKIRQHVEQFSQKTNWEVAADLPYNKDAKKIST